MFKRWFQNRRDSKYVKALSARLIELDKFALERQIRIDGRDLARYLSIVMEHRHLPELIELVNVCSYRPAVGGKLSVIKGGTPVEVR